jgi:hypothetical protein
VAATGSPGQARWAGEISNAGQQPVFALVCLVLAALTLLAAFLD